MSVSLAITTVEGSPMSLSDSKPAYASYSVPVTLADRLEAIKTIFLNLSSSFAPNPLDTGSSASVSSDRSTPEMLALALEDLRTELSVAVLPPSTPAAVAVATAQVLAARKSQWIVLGGLDLLELKLLPFMCTLARDRELGRAGARSAGSARSRSGRPGSIRPRLCVRCYGQMSRMHANTGL
jgi:hypothetical protein